MLRIKGPGDPSRGNGGISFLKMPLKISNENCGMQDSLAIRVGLNPAIQNPKSVTGTDADLRRLKKEDIYNKLVYEMGFDKNEV